MFSAKEKDPTIHLKKACVVLNKYLYPITAVILLIILLIVGFFLYTSVWLSIGHAQNVANLKKQVLEETLQTGKLDQVIENLQTKTVNTADSIKNVNNPFEKK